ncbi:hypothetical protein [Knoellia sp. p5-6-4]|nr:hypothetical protein [Knoellia sp. p5-6-4]MDF2146359.1 hypothetical protein [Knoellia sp. p5-6-4]
MESASVHLYRCSHHLSKRRVRVPAAIVIIIVVMAKVWPTLEVTFKFGS